MACCCSTFSKTCSANHPSGGSGNLLTYDVGIQAHAQGAHPSRLNCSPGTDAVRFDQQSSKAREQCLSGLNRERWCPTFTHLSVFHHL